MEQVTVSSDEVHQRNRPTWHTFERDALPLYPSVACPLFAEPLKTNYRRLFQSVENSSSSAMAC